MKVSISEAKAQLAELVCGAKAGEEVILTRHGKSAVKLVPFKQTPTCEEKMALMEDIRALARKPTEEEKRALIEALQAAAKKSAIPGPCAARSQDFLYGDDGMPE